MSIYNQWDKLVSRKTTFKAYHSWPLMDFTSEELDLLRSLIDYEIENRRVEYESANDERPAPT